MTKSSSSDLTKWPKTHLKELKALFPGFLRLLESPGRSRVRPFFPENHSRAFQEIAAAAKKDYRDIGLRSFRPNWKPIRPKGNSIRSLLRSARVFFLVRLGQYLNSVAPSVSLELAPCLVECLKLLHTHFFNVKLKRWGRNSSATTACTLCCKNSGLAQ